MKLFAALALTAAISAPATAAQYSMRGDTLVVSGTIEDADGMLFGRQVSAHNPSAVELNSPGGKVAAAIIMADILHKRDMPVIVRENAMCASACFMIFASAGTKTVDPGAKIGVHRVSNGGESENSEGTVMMADFYARAGVPPAIIGKMASTAPGAVAWLTNADLREMGVNAGAVAEQPEQDRDPIVSRQYRAAPMVAVASLPRSPELADVSNNWRVLVDNAMEQSSNQNGGKPHVINLCEENVCQSMVLYRDASGRVIMTRVNRNQDNQIISREQCIYNSPNERTCRNFETGSIRRDSNM